MRKVYWLCAMIALGMMAGCGGTPREQHVQWVARDAWDPTCAEKAMIETWKTENPRWKIKGEVYVVDVAASFRLTDDCKSGLPLVGITLAAVPCPDTPLILTLHWHGFIREKLAELEQAEAVSFTPLPSSALQLNHRWRDLIAVDRAAMEAAWELGAWDVARAERRGRD